MRTEEEIKKMIKKLEKLKDTGVSYVATKIIEYQQETLKWILGEKDDEDIL